MNEEIYEEFVKEFTEENGELAFVALSMKDYENLALNVAELRRYINQQKNIIICVCVDFKTKKNIIIFVFADFQR